MKFEKFKEIMINIDPNGYGDHEVSGNIKISWIKMLKSIDNLI